MAFENRNFESDRRSLSPTIDFTRRGMMVTTLATGFAASVQPVMAQTVITADYRPSFREAPAKDGWAKLTAFLKANGVA